MGPEEETLDEVLQRKREAERRIEAKVRSAEQRIRTKHASELAQIDEDLSDALRRHALEMALRALSPEQVLKVLGN